MKSVRGIKIASIRGIELKVDASLLLLMLYVIFVSAAQFPLVARQAGFHSTDLSLGPVASGIVFALGLFISIVLHELGHSLFAQACGVPVRSITLMMLGGVSSMDRIPDRPYFEFKLSVIGPLVSFALGGALFWIRTLTDLAELSFFCYWLGSVNIILGAFNLLPAFPLDGGRALRSALSARKGAVRATRTSVQISKALAVGLGILGAIGFNLILVLIALFIYMSAQSELFLLLSRGLLQGMTAGEVMTRVEAIEDSQLISAAAQQMLKNKVTALPVLTAPAAPAVLLLSQIKEIPRQLWDKTVVSQNMHPAAKYVQESEQIGPLLSDLAAAPGGTLPVLSAGMKLVGIVQYEHLTEILKLRSLEEAPPVDEKRVA